LAGAEGAGMDAVAAVGALQAVWDGSPAAELVIQVLT
jgi:hypothetical protein